MKLSVPASTIIAMALYGTSSAAFSLGRQTMGRKVVSNAAKIFGATAYLGYSPVAASAANNISTRSFAKSSALNMAEKTPFKTWTFDKACDTMEFNDVSSASITITDDLKTIDDSDLVIIGVYGPKKDEDDEDDEEEKKDDEEIPKPTLTGKAKDLDDLLEGALTDLMEENYKAFKHGAAAGTATPVLRIFSGDKTKRIMLLGLGNEGKDMEDGFVGKIGSALATQCDTNKKVKTCSIVLPTSFPMDEAHLPDLSTEFYNTLYSDNRYRTGDKIKNKAEDLKTVTIVAEGGVADYDAAIASIESGKAIAAGVSLTKDIVNAPHNVLNSESLANVARKIAEESGGTIKCIILGKEECEKRGMGAYLGVARGSETEPQFIHLTYSPKSGNVKKKVGIVGKGLLFDTGGYNIKTAMMELMKFDCGGSVSAIAITIAITIEIIIVINCDYDALIVI